MKGKNKMKKKKSNGREITFYSPKCGCAVTVFGTAARDLAERLEKDDSVLNYKSKIPFTVNPSETSVLGIRSSYIHEEWVSDFSVETIEGAVMIIEAISSNDLEKKSEIEKLELSRRYWASKGIRWRVCITENTQNLRYDGSKG